MDAIGLPTPPSTQVPNQAAVALAATTATGGPTDTLANTVNNSSGELIDLYYAMKYVGPTAHSMGVSIQETATAVRRYGRSTR